MRRALDRLTLAVVLHAVVTLIGVSLAIDNGRPWALLAAGGPLLALGFRRSPPIVAAGMIGSGLILGAAWYGLAPTDPLDLARYASDRALSGQNPYGVVYPNGTAYTYGPLGLVVYRLGIHGEVAAMLGLGVLLAWQRAWVTLALTSALPVFAYTAFTGANDHTPTFLLALGLILLRSRPGWGAVTLAAAVAVKPYAAAWALPAVGFGGWSVLWIGAGASALLWSPLLVWGVGSFAESVRSLEAAWAGMKVHASWSLDLPLLRWVALPIALAGLLVRDWRSMCLVGAAVFAVYLGFAPWANLAHLLPLVVAIGLGLEVRTRSPEVRPTPPMSSSDPRPRSVHPESGGCRSCPARPSGPQSTR